MKYKVSELKGAFLDAAVALADGEYAVLNVTGEPMAYCEGGAHAQFSPSTMWEQGGPIIEREHINLIFDAEDGFWAAYLIRDRVEHEMCSNMSALVAAMRAYVASRFGDEVDLPTFNHS